MKNFKYIMMITLLAGIVAGCGSSEEHETQEIAPVHAKIDVAKATSTSRSIRVSGRIEAGNSANVSTRMMGNVTDVLVKAGDRVKKGALLLVISSADLKAKKAQVEATILQAKSAFENAAKDYERFQILFEKGSASQKELDNMTTRYEMAKAGLDAAKQMENEVDAQFAYTNLRAPFSGVVANTFVKVGDIANPGMPLATVEGTSVFEATVMIPESKVSQIRPGAEASVLVKSKNTYVKGKVKEVSPSAKNTGGQFIAKITLENAPEILPGMFVNADIKVAEETTSTSPVVAKEALLQNGQLTGIYTLGQGNTAVLRWVRIGQDMGDKVEVLSGIADGEKYILQAKGKLFNGAKVVFN